MAQSPVRAQGILQINVAVVALVISVVAQGLWLARQLGQLETKVESNISRIAALEAIDRARIIDERRRDERGARIEAKLDQIMPDRREAHP